MNEKPNKVLFVATVVKTHIMTFHLPFLKMFQDMGWETTVVARNDYENPSDCRIPYCDHYIDMPFQRNPFHLDNFRCYKRLKKMIDEGGFTLIHCHTPVGGMLGRLAARNSRKKGTRVMYTAHGFHFYKGAPLKNWLLYYPAEKLSARFSDAIISINQEDFGFAKKHFSNTKIYYLPGVGVDVERFMKSAYDKAELHERLEFGENAKVILSVGELNENKNQRVILKALTYPGMEKVHYMIAGQGHVKSELERYAESLNIRQRVHFLGFRKDIAHLLKNADVFVFPSYREGLPVALMEAMSSGVPVVVSRVRGNMDLVEHDVNGFLCEPNDAAAFARHIVTLLEDQALRDRFVKQSSKKIQKYHLGNVMLMAKDIYDEVLQGSSHGG